VPAPICLIVNPAAGGGRAGRVAPLVEQALRAHKLDIRCVNTRDLPHARELAREAACAGETVVALSGDGMIGAVADVLRELPDALLGVLPGGRGNDLARVLGIPEDPVAACEVIVGGVPRAMDLGEVDGHTFVGIASAGFDSEANRIANKAPAWLGNLVYAYGALRALAAWRPATFWLSVDGEERTFTGYSVGAANSRAYGGGMYAAPDAMLDDGLLDIVYLERIPKLRFLTRILPRVFKGRHVHQPSVHVLRGRELQLSADRPFALYADGEEIAQLPVRVRALKGAVRVLVPAQTPGSAFAGATGSAAEAQREDGAGRGAGRASADLGAAPSSASAPR
jgi:YegS/Rv2252/BmrU family lipid kinase